MRSLALPRCRCVVRETEARSGAPSNTARKAVQPHAIAQRPAAFVTHGTVPKFNGGVPRERQHPEVTWVLHGAPGLEAAVCHPVEFVPDPAEERGLRLPHDEDIAKLDTWSPLHRGLLRSPRRAHVGRGEVPSRRRAAGLGTGSQLRLLRSASRVKLTHYRWLTPWTPYPSRGRLLAAHDESHPSRAQPGRSGGRDGAARRLGHRRADCHRHRGRRPRHLRAARRPRGRVVLASRDQRLAQRHSDDPPQYRVRAHPTPPHRRSPGVHDRRLRRLLPLPHHLPDPPRPRGLGPLPRSGVAAPRLRRAARPAHRAGGVGRAPGADDYPPRLARPLRPSPAAGAGDAAHLALRLGQRRPGVRSPLPRRPLNPIPFFVPVRFASLHHFDGIALHFATSARRIVTGRHAPPLDARRRRSIASCPRKEGAHEGLDVCCPRALPPPTRRLASTGFPRRGLWRWDAPRRLRGRDARRRRAVRHRFGFPRRVRPGLPRPRLRRRSLRHPSGGLPRGLRSLPRRARALPRPSRLRLPLPPYLPSPVSVLLQLRPSVLLPVLPDRHRQPPLLLPALRVLRERALLLFPLRYRLLDRGYLLRPHPPLPSFPRYRAALPHRRRLARRLHRLVARQTPLRVGKKPSVVSEIRENGPYPECSESPARVVVDPDEREPQPLGCTHIPRSVPDVHGMPLVEAGAFKGAAQDRYAVRFFVARDERALPDFDE